MRKELEQKIHEFTEQIYGAGYVDGYNDASCANDYQRGLNDAWRCIRKLEEMPNQAVMDIFHFGSIYKIARNYTAAEITAKIKEYEEKQKKDCETCKQRFCSACKDGDCYEQEEDNFCSDFECDYNFKGDCKNAKKCDDFKPITKNETTEQQIGKSCMNCKYHVTDSSNPTFPCFLIRRGHNCTNLSAWESNVVEELYSNEEKQTDDEIKVGDEVICHDGFKSIIIYVWRSGDTTYYQCLDNDGVNTENDKEGKPIKTGRHFPQIAEVLKQMKGVER